MNRSASALLIVVFAMSAGSPPARAQGKGTEALQRFAFVAGANDGGPNRTQLRYAHTDARAMVRVLRQLGGVDPADTVLLVEPDRYDFEAGIARMHNILINNQRSGVRSELVFYFSGHSDEQGLLFGDDLFTYRELREAIKDLPADVRIAILDSCASGAVTRGKGGTRRPPFLMDSSVEVEGYAYLTSASADESAQESDRVKGSFFTHYLVSGLRGAADNNRDQKVTLNEAYQYAFNETLARTESTQSGPQHPGYDFQLKGSGDLVLTDLRGTSAMLQLAGDIKGRVFIRNRKGDLIAEINKAEGRPIDLGLDPGHYEVSIESGGELRKGAISLQKGQTAILSAALLTQSTRETTVARGETAPTAAPEAAAPVAAAPVSDPYGEPVDRRFVTRRDGERVVHRPFRFALFPGVTIPHWRTVPGKQLNRVSINFVGYGHYLQGFEAGALANMRAFDVDGFQAAGIFNHVAGNQTGFQGAGIFNMVHGNAYGFQGAGIYNLNLGETGGFRGAGIFNYSGGAASGFMGAGITNIVTGPVKGFEGAGIVNINTNSSHGFQGAGIANINGGSAMGFQGAGIVNVNGNSMYGFQGAGIANISAHSFSTGFQGAGILNYTSAFRGAQFAGITNISTDTLKGAQFGLINIGREVKGAQIGLINIASKRLDGAAVGLISYSGNGILAPTFWVSDTSIANVGIKMGSRHVYGILGMGVHPLPNRERYSILYGFGGHLDFDRLWLELDIMYHVLVDDYRWAGENGGDFITKFRPTLGYRVADELSIFAGPTLNLLHANNINKAEVIPAFYTYTTSYDANLRLSMGFLVGLQWEPDWRDLNSREPEAPETE